PVRDSRAKRCWRSDGDDSLRWRAARLIIISGNLLYFGEFLLISESASSPKPKLLLLKEAHRLISDAPFVFSASPASPGAAWRRWSCSPLAACAPIAHLPAPGNAGHH